MKTDEQLQKDVLEELRWDPRITGMGPWNDGLGAGGSSNRRGGRLRAGEDLEPLDEALG